MRNNPLSKEEMKKLKDTLNEALKAIAEGNCVSFTLTFGVVNANGFNFMYGALADAYLSLAMLQEKILRIVNDRQVATGQTIKISKNDS